MKKLGKEYKINTRKLQDKEKDTIKWFDCIIKEETNRKQIIKQKYKVELEKVLEEQQKEIDRVKQNYNTFLQELESKYKKD